MTWWGIWPVLFLTAATPVAALSLDFSHTPSSIDQNQQFTVDVSLSCSSCSDSYLRGVFFLSPTNYFGFTQNNAGLWVNVPGSQASQYFQVLKDEVKEGSWSGQLTVKPDIGDPKYAGPGSYFFKVGRYTSGGSVTWAAAVPISISGPAPTSFSSPQPTAKTATPTPALPSPTSLILPTIKSEVEKVLSSSDSAFPTLISLIPSSPSSAPSPSQDKVPSSSKNWPAYALIGLGSLVFLSSFVFKL